MAGVSEPRDAPSTPDTAPGAVTPASRVPPGGTQRPLLQHSPPRRYHCHTPTPVALLGWTVILALKYHWKSKIGPHVFAICPLYPLPLHAASAIG